MRGQGTGIAPEVLCAIHGSAARWSEGLCMAFRSDTPTCVPLECWSFLAAFGDSWYLFIVLPYLIPYLISSPPSLSLPSLPSGASLHPPLNVTFLSGLSVVRSFPRGQTKRILCHTRPSTRRRRPCRSAAKGW